jgi:hypothetical protein
MQEALTIFVLWGWKEPPVRIFFRGILLYDQCDLSQDNSSYLLGDGDFMVEHARFLNIPNEPELTILILQTLFLFQREDI